MPRAGDYPRVAPSGLAGLFRLSRAHSQLVSQFADEPAGLPPGCAQCGRDEAPGRPPLERARADADRLGGYRCRHVGLIRHKVKDSTRRGTWHQMDADERLM
jgi:hypothetical protein